MNVATGKRRNTLQYRSCSSVFEIYVFIKGNEYPKHEALSIPIIMNQES